EGGRNDPASPRAAKVRIFARRLAVTARTASVTFQRGVERSRAGGKLREDECPGTRRAGLEAVGEECAPGGVGNRGMQQRQDGIKIVARGREVVRCANALQLRAHRCLRFRWLNAMEK